MVASKAWQLSWWEYHLAMLRGFSVSVGALLHQYRTGDLSASDRDLLQEFPLAAIVGLALRRDVRFLRALDASRDRGAVFGWALC
jgi:hypothetical protein